MVEWPTMALFLYIFYPLSNPSYPNSSFWEWEKEAEDYKKKLFFLHLGFIPEIFLSSSLFIVRSIQHTAADQLWRGTGLLQQIYINKSKLLMSDQLSQRPYKTPIFKILRDVWNGWIHLSKIIRYIKFSFYIHTI